ncbi:MAG: BlaI/MecI/CopY family transcriptional regulator [Eubacteriales bacterium]
MTSAQPSDSFISRIFAGKWQGLIANLVDAGKITDDDIAEIERIIGEGTKK